jgi:hypothetical protein
VTPIEAARLRLLTQRGAQYHRRRKVTEIASNEWMHATTARWGEGESESNVEADTRGVARRRGRMDQPVLDGSQELRERRSLDE